nr:MAG TPA_asm: hypothetical protein [Bacteriophage sp.]
MQTLPSNVCIYYANILSLYPNNNNYQLWH